MLSRAAAASLVTHHVRRSALHASFSTTTRSCALEEAKTNQQERAIRLGQAAKRQRRRHSGSDDRFTSSNSSGPSRNNARSQRVDKHNLTDGDGWGRSRDRFAHAPDSARERAFQIGAQLRKIRTRIERYPNTNLHQAWEEASRLASEIPTGNRRSAVIAHTSLIDLALHCGKAQEAQKAYSRLKKEGLTPSPATFGVIFRGLTRKGIGARDTQLQAWAAACFDEFQQLRKGAWQRSERSTSAAFARMERLTSSVPTNSVYAAYIGLAISMGQTELAWDVISRAGNSVLSDPTLLDGPTCITATIMARWHDNVFLIRGTAEPPSRLVLDRTAQLWRQWLDTYRRNADEVVERWEAAMDEPSVQGAIVEAWKQLLPSAHFFGHMSWSKIHPEPAENAEFEGLALDMLKELMALDPAAPRDTGPWGSPRPIGDPAHPLCGLLTFNSTQPDINEERLSKNQGELLHHVRASLTAFRHKRQEARAMSLHILLNTVDEQLGQARLMLADGSRPPPQHPTMMYFKFLHHPASAFRLLSSAPDSVPEKDLGHVTMRIMSCIKQVRQLGLSCPPPDSGTYYEALRSFEWGEERHTQICNWWLEDMAEAFAEKDTKPGDNPWTLDTVRCSHAYARDLLASLETDGGGRSSRSDLRESSEAAEAIASSAKAAGLESDLVGETFQDDLRRELRNSETEDSTGHRSTKNHDNSLSRDRIMRGLKAWHDVFSPFARASTDKNSKLIPIAFPTFDQLSQARKYDNAARAQSSPDFVMQSLSSMGRAFAAAATTALELGEHDRSLGPLQKHEVQFLKSLRKTAVGLRVEMDAKHKKVTGKGAEGEEDDTERSADAKD